ncbi:LysM and putative peptidoglycan-binding domain-containing protein 1 [Rhizophlyctis rosea]|uniref:LysM and putative peptidoglycan-binding domain-containing protein 1 n=1 Tax=Rhizophlyctis rosea TaxID=64517 RepID=A0AAD5S4N5_9FUNG|nr:LysM and putative peptidoglycan-binding domain-containing protein 1 [Rhizophlyctis rosea]
MTTPPIPATFDPLTSATPLTPAEIEQAIAQAKHARRQKTHYTHLQPQHPSSSGKSSQTHSRSSSLGSSDIAAAAGASTAAYGEIVVHEIKPGDTLEGICLMYGAKASDIKRHNRLWTTDSIHLHKTLEIPIRPPPSTTSRSHSRTSSTTPSSYPSPCPSPRPNPTTTIRTTSSSNPPQRRVDDLLKKVDEDLIKVIKQMETSGLKVDDDGRGGGGGAGKGKKVPLYPPPPMSPRDILRSGRVSQT